MSEKIDYHLDLLDQKLRLGDIVAFPGGKNDMGIGRIEKLTEKMIMVDSFGLEGNPRVRRMIERRPELKHMFLNQSRRVYPSCCIKLDGAHLTKILLSK